MLRTNFQISESFFFKIDVLNIFSKGVDDFLYYNDNNNMVIFKRKISSFKIIMTPIDFVLRILFKFQIDLSEPKPPKNYQFL